MCEAGLSFVTLNEAAELLKTTETRVLMMLKKQELNGKFEEEAWHVDRSSLKLCVKPEPADIVRHGGCGGGCGGGCS